MISENLPDGDSRLLYGKADLLLKRIHPIINQANPVNDSLLSGRLGLVLYYFTRFEVFGDQQDKKKGIDTLHIVFQHLNNNESDLLNPSYSGGISGFLYILNYLSVKELYHSDLREYVEYDQYLYTKALELSSLNFNDYLHGLFGILFYFVSRLPDPDIQEKVESILLKLFSYVPTHKDAFWIRNSIPEEGKKDEINFSLSHGQSAFLLILLKIFEKGILTDTNRDFISRGINYIINHQQEIDYINNMYSFFPILINNETNELKYSNRLAWCYGDLNELLLLYRAANTFSDQHYIKMGDIIGGSTVNRTTLESTLCMDSHFCHGSSGVAQFYQTLYHVRGLPYYKAAYTTWIDKTIQFLDKEMESDSYKNKETFLLDGLVGVSLTLLSYVSPKPLQWSECLML